MLQIVRGRLQNGNSARHGELQFFFYYSQPSMQNYVIKQHAFALLIGFGDLISVYVIY